MRILQVNSSDIVGGATRIAHNLFDAYRDRGLESWLAVGNKQGNDPNVLRIPNFEYLNKWGKLCISFSNKLSPLVGKVRGAWRLQKWLKTVGQPRKLVETQRGHEYFDFPATWKLLEITHNQPDIIHCHNLHSDYFDLRVLPWLGHQVPVALTLHDEWLLSGHCAYTLNCLRWRTGCGHCPDLSIYPPIRRDATEYNWSRKRAIYARSHLYITTPSQWLMNEVEQSILAPAVQEARVIHNGVDLSVFQPGDKQAARAALGLPNDITILLFVGHGTRKNQFKDYSTMEGAINRVAANSDGNELLFVCLGEQGGDQLFGKARIRFVEYQKDLKKVAQFYQAADIYLHAARADTFPNVILEALACGTPVIGTAVGGIPEQIKDGVTGFLVPPGDGDMMADRIMKLLVDKKLSNYCSQHAIKRTKKFYDLNHQVKNYLAWYEEIIEKWKKIGN
jgi:glycosyltransferase involved in cell wall biosynthesis